SSDIMETTIHFNSRFSESHRFELLDPNTSNESSEDELIESNEEDEDIELSKLKAELLTKSDINSEDE
ncbi:2614_t:CDS:1, partial [Racocetra fulgida]